MIRARAIASLVQDCPGVRERFPGRQPPLPRPGPRQLASGRVPPGLGAEPVAYGEGMPGRVRAIAPGWVDLALDVAGNGVLPELIDLAGGADHVVTIAGFPGAQENGVRLRRGDTGRAFYALALAAQLADAGRFRIPVGATFPLADIAEAHRTGESGKMRGKLVLLVGRGS